MRTAHRTVNLCFVLFSGIHSLCYQAKYGDGAEEKDGVVELSTT